MNFTYDLIDGEQNWGQLIGPDIWKGSVGHVFNGTADIGICGISISYPRALAIHFTAVVITDELGFISQSSAEKPQIWLFMEPFSMLLWLIILISFFAILLTLYLTTKFLDYTHDPGKVPSFASMSMNLYAILLGKSINTDTREHYQIRIIYLLFILAMIVLSPAYCASFYSLLTIPKYQKPIDTIGDLLQAAQMGFYKIITVPHGAYYDTFVNSPSALTTLHIIGQHLNRFVSFIICAMD